MKIIIWAVVVATQLLPALKLKEAWNGPFYKKKIEMIN